MQHYSFRCPFCGATHTKPEWWLKLLLIFKDTYTLNCKVCHHKSIWINTLWLKHDSTNKEEKLFNKGKLFDDRL